MVNGYFYVLSFGAVTSGIMVISALNPVHSVFWLVVAFTSSAALFILLGVDFVALMFIIIYVGAIAILFLFVIMLLNLFDLPPIIGAKEEIPMTNYILVGLVVGVLFFEAVAFSWFVAGVPYIYKSSLGGWNLANPWFLTMYHNISAIGQILYIDCYYLLFIASFILLIAMLGAIVLTQEMGSEAGPTAKKQNVFFQQHRVRMNP